MSAGAPEQERKLLHERAQRLLASDYFVALGVARTASAQEITKAFIDAAKTWHPDRTPPAMPDLRPLMGRVFTHLDQARTILTDPTRRALYIEELAKPATSGDITSAEAMLAFRKAEALLKKNDAVGAEEHVRHAVSLAPQNAQYHALLISLQAKPDTPPQRLRELVTDLDRVIARDDRCERAFFVRGQIRKRLGLVAEAARDFARAAELNPKNIDAAREVRIHQMRAEKSAAPPPKTDAPEGVGGFFKKLFKR